MTRLTQVTRGAAAVWCLLAASHTAAAQSWQRASELPLVQRAASLRAARDADALLDAWQAVAHGVVRFASVLEHGEGPVERVIRADELRLEVYGEAPNRSKQIITAWRDTSFLPNNMVYHRDHLGIVANDFGATIRLGQGDEVRDVPHPLSARGLAMYEFAEGDTVSISGPAGLVRVVAIDVRPGNADSAGTVGTMYVDLERAALVRFRFTFTRASYRDPTVASISVTLENALLERARWLPWRQSIVIERGIPWIDLPFRTVIRADWTIGDYQLGVHHPPGRFIGAPIDGPRIPLAGGTWDGPITAMLDALPATGADVDVIARDAAELVRGRILDGLPRVQLLGRGLSDFLHVNRVEGITPAVGARAALSGRWSVRGRVGAGLSDHRLIGDAAIAGTFDRLQLELSAERTARDIGDMPVISGVANSIGTLLSGNDLGDYTLLERVGIDATTTFGGARIALAVDRERSRSLETRFTALDGTAAPNPDLGDVTRWLGSIRISRHDAAGDGWTVSSEVDGHSWRGRLDVLAHMPLSRGSIAVTGSAGLALGTLPTFRTFVLGGRGTLPGVPFRAIGGAQMALLDVGWSIPLALPTPPIPYSRLVRVGSVLEPFVAAGVSGGDAATAPWRATGVIEPVVGARLDLWGPLLRIEAGTSLRTGRTTIALDVHPDWWGVL